jgi:hypothetical protein
MAGPLLQRHFAAWPGMASAGRTSTPALARRLERQGEPMAECIDLAAMFGEQYRIGHDEAAATWGERRDPWMMTIPCRLGTIFPHGGRMLAVEVDYHPSAARKLAKLPGVTIHQDGGFHREMTFLFPVEMFSEVAAIAQPRRRKRLSAEHRAKCVAALERHRGGQTPCQNDGPSGLEPHAMASGDE